MSFELEVTSGHPERQQHRVKKRQRARGLKSQLSHLLAV